MDSLKAFLLDHQTFPLRGERGATAVEYGLMASLIALAIVVGVTAFGNSVNGLFQLAVDKTPFFR